MVGFDSRQIGERHRSGRFGDWFDGRGWQSHQDVVGSTTLGSGISSSQIRTRNPKPSRSRPNRTARTSHDFRDARQVRLNTQVGSIQATPTHHHWCNRSQGWRSRRATTGKRWWCVGGSVSLAKSHEGQFLFHLLREFSLTPQQWRELDPRDRTFLASAFSHSNEIQNRAQQQRGVLR
jgi:hypothetical protein